VIFVENSLVRHDALHQNTSELYLEGVLALLQSRVVVNVFGRTPQFLLSVIDNMADDCLLLAFRVAIAAASSIQI
jgi:hypothetical protein